MRERAERLGGEFQVESTPGKGTRIIAALPVLPVKREVGAFHPSRTIHQTK